MHFNNTQDYLRFVMSKPEDYREPKKYVEAEEKPKRGKKAKDGEVLQAD